MKITVAEKDFVLQQRALKALGSPTSAIEFYGKVIDLCETTIAEIRDVETLLDDIDDDIRAAETAGIVVDKEFIASFKRAKTALDNSETAIRKVDKIAEKKLLKAGALEEGAEEEE